MTPSVDARERPPVGAPAGWAAQRLSLRAATAADQPFLRQLYGSFRAEELEPVPWPPAAKEQFLDSQFALQTRHFTTVFADADFLIVEDAGRPIGRLCLHRAREAYLVVDIGFLPDRRGRGLGSQLLDHVRALAGAEGVSVVRLHVSIHNPRAQALYRRLGFAVVEDDGPYRTMDQPVS